MTKNDLNIKQGERPDFPALEEKVLDYWDEVHAFEQSVEQRPENKHYVFYDGPPFATGLPHYGHILASTTKDVIPRYWTMKGYRVERVWGWDCHGLPIENILEKELKLKDREDIEEYGVENFNNACKLAVLRYRAEWMKIVRRMGRWADMKNDYKTMDSWYMESLWWVFRSLWEREYIYQGHKSMHICPRCNTPLSNFEVTQGYKEVKDVSVFVEFEVKNTKKLHTKKKVYILAWTTTPWTLPGNVLLAVNPEIEYVLFESNAPDNQYLVAKDRLEEVLDGDPYSIVREFRGKDLVGLSYEPVFPYFKDTENAFQVVEGDFVTTGEGTGVVHIAPGFGEDDYALGIEHDIELIQHVGMDGKFTQDVKDFAGLRVKPKDNPLETDVKLLKWLQEKDVVFRKQNIKHTYPHCWRCDTPLINYATDSWFVRVTDFKEQLLVNNAHINWIPDHIQSGRFGKWLEGARDWAISRNRYWGTPLPVWQADDGETICVGSIAELEELSGEKVTDLHKHVIDKVIIKKGGKEFRRIPEVLDCWFESGAMPYASFHYPFENKAKFEKNFPAEFISEGQDQTRGWFYTLHVLATALTMGSDPAIPVEKSTSSFKNCVVSGIVLAEDGKKMSKRLKNYPDPMLVGEKYGIDSLRLYLMSSPVVRADNLNFNEKEVDDIRRKVLNIFWNVFSFYKLYDNGKQDFSFPENPQHVMDKWLTSKMRGLSLQVVQAMDEYDVVTASRALMDFVQEFSTWWLRLSRERLRDSESNTEALQVFRASMLRWLLLMAPFAPFFSEILYQQLVANAKDSIHLELLPSVDEIRSTDSHPDLETKMDEVRKVVEKTHAVRKEKGIQLRQPLAILTVNSPVDSPMKNLLEVLAQEVNVKQVIWNKAKNLSIALDTKLTKELCEEGEAREIIRSIQQARRKAKTEMDEEIEVVLPSWPKKFENEIKNKVLATKLIQGDALEIHRKENS